jgi:mono/diheme cytochrome c family protein
LTEGETRQLLSYLWMRQFVYAKGDAARGKKVFTDKRCAECHMGGEHGAPPLAGQGRRYSEITIISALWKHGPQMFTRMRQAKVVWPRFNNAQQMSDLVAYLNSVQ